jgi:hypothetical protein
MIEQEQIFQTPGLLIDIITTSQGPLDNPDTKNALNHPLRSSILDIQSFYERIKPNGNYFTGEDSLTAFARTMLMDNVSRTTQVLLDGRKTPQNLVDLWQVFSKTRINPDDTLDLDQAIRLPDPTTGAPTSRDHTVLTAQKYMDCLIATLAGRKFFGTRNGYIGLGPAMLKPGDLVAIIAGSATPFVLRPHMEHMEAQEQSKIPHLQIVADCYLHGFMYGEIQNEGYREILQECAKLPMVLRIV